MINGTNTNLFLLVGLLLLLFACNKPKPAENKLVIAQVGNKILYQTQINKISQHNFISDEDSIKFVKDYIDKWIKNQLLVEAAEKNLSKSELDIAQELEDYRQELIIHKFKNKKFKELVETEISEAEIENYFNKNKKLFLLEYPIVQVNYVIFPASINLPANFKHLLTSNREADIIDCEDYIFKFAKKYDDFNNKWIYFQYFKEQGNLNIPDEERYLRNTNLIEYRTETELRLIYIRSYLLPGQQAPIEFVDTRISSLIVNEKKIDFLRQFKDSLYNDALKYNKFRVFNQ